MKNLTKITLILFSLLIFSGCKETKIINYPAPEGEPAFDMYSLKVNGEDVFVYQCRVSERPENQVWPGYQRPKDQTELAGFAYWDQKEPAKVEVTSTRDIDDVVIRPLSLDIEPKVEENKISFTLSQPSKITVEVNGIHHALHLFSSEPQNFDVAKNDPNVNYFGPGIHNPDRIKLKDNQTVYIAGGAVVYGGITADDAENVKILGRGILDASRIKREEQRTMLSFQRCNGIKVSGIILRNPHVWAAVPRWCQNVIMEDIKLIGCWRYNSDGFDILDSRDCKVSDCFLRTFDDALVVKSFDPNAPDHLNKNIVFEDCVIWNDWGVSLGVTYETRAKKIRGITFRNCDVIHNIAARDVMTINPNDRGEVSNVLYEDIRVEDARAGLIELIIRTTHWSSDPEPGHIKNVNYKNISVLDGPFPESNFQGLNKNHKIENVTIKNLNILGEKIKTPEQGKFKINEFVEDLKILPGS